MKKITLYIMSAVLLLGLIACSNQNVRVNNDQSVVNNNEQSNKVVKKDDVREIVWKQLSSEQKEWIDGTWTDGKVSKLL
nr:hypothetical protein [Neobacillus sp. Marseille-Q6967]